MCACVHGECLKEVWREGGAIIPLQVTGRAEYCRTEFCLCLSDTQKILTLILACEVPRDSLRIPGDTSVRPCKYSGLRSNPVKFRLKSTFHFISGCGTWEDLGDIFF